MNVWKAAKAGKLDWFEGHVEAQGTDQLNLSNKGGETPLMIAVKEQQDEVVQFLLEKRADPNKINKAKQSALVIAITEFCGEEIINTLLSHNAEVNIKDADGLTALQLAARAEQESVVRMLLEHGANPNESADEKGLSALHYAANHGNLGIAQALLSSGANKDALNKQGETPLLVAINADAYDVARELINNGCDVNVQDKDGDTALHTLAVKDNTIELVRLILAKQPNLDVRNKQGDTALECARGKAMRDLLLKHGATGDVEKHKQTEEEASKSSSAKDEEAGRRTTKASVDADNSEEPVSPRAVDEGEKTSAKKLRHRTPRKNEDESEVDEFLGNAGLEVHAPRFKRNKLVALEDLEAVDEKQLKKMNITAGEREKILAELVKLQPELNARREAREKAEKEALKVKGNDNSGLLWAIVAGAVAILSLAIFLGLQG